MKKTSVIILSALTVLSVSCAKDNLREKTVVEKPQVNLVPMTFTASSVTKTAVASNGKSVNWVAGDKIAVFDDIVGDALEFKLTGEGGSTSASFTGSVPEGSKEYYAVYPYDSKAYCLEGDITGLTISADQTSTATNISAGIMAAKADANNKFAFKNATALLKFNITATDIAKVVITGAGGEKIAGDVELTVDETAALLDETKLTETSITVGDGSTALAAGDYYVVIAPKDELSGLKFTFTSTDGLTAELSGVALSIAAGDLLNLGTLTPNFTDITVAQLLEKIAADDDITKFNVVGVVSYSETQGTVFSRGMVLLQDNVDKPNTGIAIFNSDASTGLYKSEDIKVGNKVKISLANAKASATTANYGLQLSEVTSSDVVEVISTGNKIVKASATAATLSSYKAQYVQIANVSPSVTGYMNTANTTYIFNSGTASINVFVKSASWNGSDSYIDNTKTGTLYGFVAYYKTSKTESWQVCPAYTDDVKDFVNTSPMIFSVSSMTLDWEATIYGSDNAKTITVNGQYLTSENLTAVLSDSKNFTSSFTVAQDGKSATITIYPVAENKSAEDYTTTLTLSAGTSVKAVTLTQVKAGGSTAVKTYQHIFTAKPSIGTTTLSKVSWTVAATNLGTYNSSSYAGVQFGTKNNAGSITLTSSSDWSYDGTTQIKEVRVWLNAGTGTPTATVTIGGKSATSDGETVKKNSSAKSYADATKITFTPADGGETGVVVINAATTSKAAYICAIEIDCK
jgi:ribosomal protein S8E